jgi:low affinity Fe/Cu permease
VKIMIALAFVLIIASLAFALFFMLRGDRKDAGDSAKNSKRMAWALTVRIGVSVLVFVCILLAWSLGYIQPHGIPLGK